MPIEGAYDVYNSREAELKREHEAQVRELSKKHEEEKESIKKKYKIDKKTELLNGDDLPLILGDLIKQVNSPNNKEGDADNIPDKVMVIMLDMNSLKFINDTYGHEFGDKALVVFAQRLKNVFRDIDFIFRKNNGGGDEFVVLMQIFNKNVDTDKIFERVKSQVNQDLFIEIGSNKFYFGGAMGYTLLEKGDKRTSSELMIEADKKMYKDKEKMKQEGNGNGLEDYSI